MADLVNILGLCATICAAAVSPTQLIVLLRAEKQHNAMLSPTAYSVNRRVHHPAQTVSLISTVLVCVCNTLWCVYGILHGAVWSAVLGIIAITVQVTVLVVCIRARVIQWWFLACLGLFLAAVAYAGYLLPAGLLGAMAASMAVLNYLPAAVKQYNAARSGVLNKHTVYSRGMGLVMFSANLLWIAYAVALRDFWVGLPCVINVITSVVFIFTHNVAVRK